MHRNAEHLQTQPQPGQRLASLDGLRGFAAVIVVFWHASLTLPLAQSVPRLVGASPRTSETTVPGTVQWWLFDTPLRIFTMGENAVTVFFVLSGLVLSLAVFRGASLDVWNYYPRRFLRLWLPSAASIALVVVISLLIPRDPTAATSEWARESLDTPLSADGIASSLFLVTGRQPYNNPLWSLKWELLFSLVLPLVLLIGMRFRSHPWLFIIGCAALCGLGGYWEIPGMQFGPMFLVGVFVARSAATRMPNQPAWQAWTFVIGGVMLIAVPDMWRTLLGGDMVGDVGRALTAFVVLGAGLVVYGLLSPSAIASLFATAPMRFLGRISFSLYLVHVPVLLGMLCLTRNAPLAVAIGVPVSFVVAWAMQRWVEAPSARWARTVGARCAALGRATTGRSGH